jgi:2-phosphoglycerate kinase
MIYVKNADEHKRRFASRCNGSMDPSLNKYVKHFDFIRAIQKSIKQIAIDSKFIKSDNDDAKRTYEIVNKIIKKYV